LSSEIPIAIIGGGVVGCAVARELSRRYKGIFLFEKNPGITKGENQSSRNSGVIHSGIYYDQKTRPEKASLCVEGNRLLYEFCNYYQVPVLKTGKLIVATTGEEERILDLYLNRAKENGVSGVKKIPGQKVSELEPNVKAQSALIVPGAGIVEPTSLVYRLHTLAHQAGVQFMMETKVMELYGGPDSLRVTLQYRDGATDHIRARAVINAAGVDADQVARLLNPNSPYELDPVRGESYKFYGHRRQELKLAEKNIYPTPESVITPQGHHFTVGIHLTPTFEDLSYPSSLGSTITVGPRLVPVEDRTAWAGDWSPARPFAEKVQSFFPGLRENDLIWHQAGLQARLKGYSDFVIHADPQYPNFINLVGIDSPGLTASLAIARRVAEMVDVLSRLTS
jgi:L-2-hydroxyglutarate oxidase LhgO